MPSVKASSQNMKMEDLEEINSIKSELDSKIKEINDLLKSAQDKGVYVKVSNSIIIIDECRQTEKIYSTVEVALSIKL